MTIKEAIYNRRSIRQFSDKKIPTETLVSYIDAARLSPSGMNLQPLKFAIVNDTAMVDTLNGLVKWAGYIAPAGNPVKGHEPTAFIAIIADLSIKKAGYEVDMGAAATTITYMAMEDNVGTCLLGAIDYAKISEILELTDTQKLLCLVALGYKDQTAVSIDAKDGDIKYYIAEDGTFTVPKRPLDEVIIKIQK